MHQDPSDGHMAQLLAGHLHVVMKEASEHGVLLTNHLGHDSQGPQPSPRPAPDLGDGQRHGLPLGCKTALDDQAREISVGPELMQEAVRQVTRAGTIHQPRGSGGWGQPELVRSWITHRERSPLRQDSTLRSRG